MGRAYENSLREIPSEMRGELAADRLDYTAELIASALSHSREGNLSFALENVTAARRRLQGVEQLIKTGKP